MTDNRTREQRNNDSANFCGWGIAIGSLLMCTPAAPLGVAMIAQSAIGLVAVAGVDAAETIHDRKYAE